MCMKQRDMHVVPDVQVFRGNASRCKLLHTQSLLVLSFQRMPPMDLPGLELSLLQTRIWQEV